MVSAAGWLVGRHQTTETGPLQDGPHTLSPVSRWGYFSSSAAAAACHFPDLVEFCDLVTTESTQFSSYMYFSPILGLLIDPLVYT